MMVMMTIDMCMRISAFRLLATEKVTFIDQDSMILLYLGIEREEKIVRAKNKRIALFIIFKNEMVKL